ncbi:MAG: universal stress protein [Gammaproteobacteria bacterium]
MLPKIRTILYCTSLGPHAPYVFGYAYALANSLDARIVALHVIESLSRKQKALVDGYAGPGRLQELIHEAQQRATEQLPRHLKETLLAVSGEEDWDRLVSEVVIAEGRAEKRIIEIVEAKGADLVVIGAHTEGSILDRMIGSTARSLVKTSPVPVLTVQVPSGLKTTT